MGAPLPFSLNAALPCRPHGDLTRALHAATLRCALPFDEPSQDRAVAALQRLRARLN